MWRPDKKATPFPVEIEREKKRGKEKGFKKIKVATKFALIFLCAAVVRGKTCSKILFFFFERTDSAKVEKLVQHGKLTVRKVARKDEEGESRTEKFYTATIKLTGKKFL